MVLDGGRLQGALVLGWSLRHLSNTAGRLGHSFCISFALPAASRIMTLDGQNVRHPRARWDLQSSGFGYF